MLKSSLDTGKEARNAKEICERFFPALADRSDPVISAKYSKLITDFDQLRELAGELFFSFYNKIESQVLLGEKTPD